MRAITLALGGVLVLAACSGNGSSGVDERQAAIYSATIAFAAGDATTPTGESFDGPVYVVGGEDNAIGIEVQADVVDELDELTVRFVDEPDEAIKESDETAPVLDEGILLTLGHIRGTGPERNVPVVAYQEIGVEEEFRVTLQRRDDRWEATGTSAPTT